MKTKRIVYAAAFAFLLLTEIMIALFVDDGFVRPYLGDVLVTILLCCLCRIIVPKCDLSLPICVFVFATLVEIAQYVNIVKLLGLENNRFLSTIIGTSFSYIDLVCYAVGCIFFWAAEKAVYHFFNIETNPVQNNPEVIP